MYSAIYPCKMTHICYLMLNQATHSGFGASPGGMSEVPKSKGSKAANAAVREEAAAAAEAAAAEAAVGASSAHHAELMQVSEIVEAIVNGTEVNPAGLSDPSLVRNLAKLQRERQLLNLPVEDDPLTLDSAATAAVGASCRADTCNDEDTAEKEGDATDPSETMAAAMGYNATHCADLYVDPVILPNVASRLQALQLQEQQEQQELQQSEVLGSLAEEAAIDFSHLNRLNFFQSIENSSGAAAAAADASAAEAAAIPAEEERKLQQERACRDPVLQHPLLVIIRHGKTEHNKLGLFTGMDCFTTGF